MTQEVAKRKTVVSLTYKPTTKPKTHEQTRTLLRRNNARSHLHRRHRCLPLHPPLAHSLPNPLNHQTMHKFKTTNIKGKDYVEVNQRLLYFRNEKAYADWSIESELVDLQPDRCCIRAVIRDAEGRIRATGHAHEDRTSSMINKTSYVENCETSAFGRALAALGIGIETSIASANEVSMAIAQQANLDDLTDRLGLVSTYSDLDMATLKADFMRLVEQLPEDQRFKYSDHKGMTPARYEKGIKFLQDQIAKLKKP